MGDKIFFFAGPEAAEDENRPVNASFAKFHAFASGGYTEPVGAEFFEGFGNFRAAVTVAVAFDDAEDLAGDVAFFGGWADVGADGVEIIAQGV